MLLFTKKIHADRLREGTKTIELRSGARYRNVREGTILSINGMFRVRVKGSLCLTSADEVQEFVSCFHKELGFASESDALIALGDCYSPASQPFFAWEVERISAEQEAPLLAVL